MVYIILSNDKTQLHTQIIEFIRIEIKPITKYKIIILKQTHIDENSIPKFTQDDIILFDPMVVYYNLEFVKLCNSVVFVERETVLVQKISKFNPVNENLAINNGFKLFYLSLEKDITNMEYSLIINEDEYLLNIEKLRNLIIN